MSQSEWQSHFIVDKVVHLENLQIETEKIVGKIRACHLNKSTKGPWQSYMTPRAIEIINEYAERDFELGDYKIL